MTNSTVITTENLSSTLETLSLADLAKAFNYLELYQAKTVKGRLAKSVKKFASKGKGIERLAKLISEVENFGELHHTPQGSFILRLKSDLVEEAPKVKVRAKAEPKAKKEPKAPAAERKFVLTGKPCKRHPIEFIVAVVKRHVENYGHCNEEVIIGAITEGYQMPRGTRPIDRTFAKSCINLALNLKVIEVA